jgi:solute carrier family 45 protein 1/2/4
MFIVIPQFLVTGMASIIFAILEPGKSVLHRPSQHAPAMGVNATVSAAEDLSAMLRRDDSVPRGPNAVAIIFR